MTAERPIEAMRDAHAGGASSGSARSRDRRRRRALRRRRIFAVLAFIVLVVAVTVLLLALLGGDEGGGSDGDFVGTWQKTNGQSLTISQTKSGDYQIVVGGGKSVTEATLTDGVLTAPNMLGVQGLTVIFTLEDGGSVLVETFSNGSSDELRRAE